MMESNLEYSRRVGGTELAPEAASEALSALPPSVLNSQKVDLGLWDGQELVAFADVILGWPAESVAHVGLLMTHGARQGGGLGRVMHDAVIDLVGRTPNIQSLRLSIVDTNADLAEPFWAKLGYEPTGESVPYVSGSVESTARIWTRPVVIA
ncbi:GNAT family N-acetyltransferase [Glutamicibacter mishrai]|uniref:GNAT family N-acetyltransferase n=1 Tax=Glutamicibacter mishrai TaxID=1775880 RepID=UPI003F78B7B2